MKLKILVAQILFFSLVAFSRGADSAGPSTTSPFDPIAFLVGGVWRGDLPPAADGKKIELRCEWAANHQGIRFDGAFLVNGKRAPYTSGVYSWNPAKHQIVFVYSDAQGNLTEGAVDLKDGALVHNFTITDPSGKVERARAVITPQGPNAYTNDIFVEKDGSF